MKQIRLWALSIVLIQMFFSCTEKDDQIAPVNSSLVGTWIDSVSVLDGYYVNTLEIDNSGAFLDKSDAFGVYPGQTSSQLSGYFVRTGKFQTESNRIGFLVEKVVSWDSFFGGEPETTIESYTIFENCTFDVRDDLLELRYTTYPADAPEQTIRVYKKHL